MRVAEVDAMRARVRTLHESAPPEADLPLGALERPFRVARPSRTRRLKDAVAPTALRLLSPVYRRQLAGVTLPGPVHRVSWGERFSAEAAMAEAFRGRRAGTWDALVQGCWLGDGLVQRCLREGARRVSGFDVLDLSKYWDKSAAVLEQAYGRRVDFRQSSVDLLPYPDASFDLVCSAAVYEHVYNLTAASAESARVLRPGGVVAHQIGPLYTTFGGDHCSPAYGPEAGFDHLLLSEVEYRRRLADTEVFRRAGDDQMQYWAVMDKLSFARPAEYYQAFAADFAFAFVVASVSSQAVWYKRTFPDRWQRLRGAGLSEADLMITNLMMVLRKK